MCVLKTQASSRLSNSYCVFTKLWSDCNARFLPPSSVCVTVHQVVLGSSIDEALTWAQQDGNLAPPAAQIVKEALAQKDVPFTSECRGKLC